MSNFEQDFPIAARLHGIVLIYNYSPAQAGSPKVASPDSVLLFAISAIRVFD